MDPPKVDAELAKIKADAEKTYASLIRQGAKIQVTRSPGNNNYPVVTIVPPALAKNTDPAAKYDVQVHYHGMHGTVAKPNGASHLKEQIEASFNRTPPTVFVLPETKNVPMQGSIGPLWRESVRDTARTAADGVAGITGTRSRLTVSAHSLGRDAIDSAIQHGGLKADRVDVQDGFSGNHPEEITHLRDWMTKNPGKDVRISYGMMTRSAIEAVVRRNPFPNGVLTTSFGGGHHWNAELQPWP